MNTFDPKNCRYSSQWRAENVLESNPKLLATSPSVEQLQKVMEKFWYAKPGEVEIKGENLFLRGKKMDDIIVSVKKGRYRAEWK